MRGAQKSEEKVGGYAQFCHDQGSDLISGTRLYAQAIQATEGRQIPITYDVAHKIANLLAVEAEELAEYGGGLDYSGIFTDQVVNL